MKDVCADYANFDGKLGKNVDNHGIRGNLYLCPGRGIIGVKKPGGP
jgi:hypothetical protein